MTFGPQFNTLECIQLLQRWILVHSFIYYELNDNISSDASYDETVNYLFQLKKEYPEEYVKSRYAKIFANYEEGCTSGFELLQKMKTLDPELYRHVHIDAALALDQRDIRKRR